jgi:putative toxin-antitoxin system antitoxin component (TIGR02293 family)
MSRKPAATRAKAATPPSGGDGPRGRKPTRAEAAAAAAHLAQEEARRALPRESRLSKTLKEDLDAYVARAQEAVSRGEHPRLDVEALSPHWRERFSEEELNAVVIPKRTLARRMRAGEPLTTEETDRALRLARIATQADRVFGDREKSARWLRKPNRAAGQQAPIVLLETETGAKLVEDLLVRIEYGMIG